MHDLGGEGGGTRNSRLRVPRIPVVTVSYQHRGVPAGALRPAAARPDSDVPAAGSGRPGSDHLGTELNLAAKAEVIDEVVEVLLGHFMNQRSPICNGDGQCPVLHSLTR